MSSCEKCWRDAGGDAEAYRRLIVERNANPCTPEEQAGPDARVCPHCKRKTIHQCAGNCTVLDCTYREFKDGRAAPVPNETQGKGEGK